MDTPTEESFYRAVRKLKEANGQPAVRKLLEDKFGCTAASDVPVGRWQEFIDAATAISARTARPQGAARPKTSFDLDTSKIWARWNAAGKAARDGAS